MAYRNAVVWRERAIFVHSLYTWGHFCIKTIEKSAFLNVLKEVLIFEYDMSLIHHH